MGSPTTLAHPPDQQEPTTPTARAAERTSPLAAERAFGRLNPTFGVPADTRDPLGQQAVRDREAALALGPRVAVASSRENDRDPVVWLAGQDYGAADAVRRARTQPIRIRHAPERVGTER